MAYKIKIFFTSFSSILTTIWLIAQILLESGRLNQFDKNLILIIFPISIVISLWFTISKKCIPRFLTIIPNTDLYHAEILSNKLLELEEFFKKTNIVLIYGLSGIGKTTLAKFFIEYKLKKYKHIAWIDYQLNIKYSFVSNNSLITNLNINTTYDTAINNELIDSYFFKIIKKLNELKGKSLLIIDDVIDDKMNEIIFSNRILDSSWDILLTSKEKIFTDENSLYNFKFFELKELRRLFYHYYKNEKDDNLVNEIINQLGFHTLAVELVANTLQHNRSVDLKKINKTLDYEGLQLSSSVNLHTKYDKVSDAKTNIFEGMIKAFSTINKLKDFDKFILIQFSVLPSIYFDYNELIELLSIDKKETTFNDSLNTLKAYSLITENDNGLKCHQIVQKVVQQMLESNFDEYEILITNIVRKLEYDPLKKKVELIKYLLCAENILKVLKFSNILISKLAHNVNDIFESFGDYKKALYYEIFAIKMQRTLFDENSLELAQSYNNLGVTLMKMKKNIFAINFLEAAMKIREDKLDRMDLINAQSYNNYGYYKYLQKKYDEAETYFKKSLEIFDYNKDIFSNNRINIEYAGTLSNLALCYIDKNQHVEVEKMLLNALDIFKNLKGEESLDVIEVEKVLGYFYNKVGDHKKASDIYQKILKKEIKIFGKYHPFTYDTTNALGFIYKKRGFFIRSNKYFIKSKIIRAHLKNNDSDRLIIN